MALTIYTKPVKTKGGLDAAKTRPAATKPAATKSAEKPAAAVAKDSFEASPRDPASGQATGKRAHKPVTTTAPRDAVTGFNTGKRLFKPTS